MNKGTHYFEIHDLLTQFVAAFDDVVIGRYNDKKELGDKINVRYVLAPKQAVIYDIVNQSKNITLPVVAIELVGVSRDSERVFNKLYNDVVPYEVDGNPQQKSIKFPNVLPVDIKVKMTIIAKYMSDIDQIVSNFMVYTNPYIILSWKVPDIYDNNYIHEIRSEVLWSGDLNYKSPTPHTSNDRYRVTVDTSFTIKGWLFQEMEDPIGNIYKIDTNFHSISGSMLSEDTMLKMYSDNNPLHTDVISISGNPSIGSIKTVNANHKISGNFDVDIVDIDVNNSIDYFILDGSWLDRTNTFYLSSNESYNSSMEFISGGLTPDIYAYPIKSGVVVVNDNLVNLHIDLKNILKSLPVEFKFLSKNPAGWGVSKETFRLK